MDFNFSIAHPKGIIKVELTNGTAQAAVATIQMGHEIANLLGGAMGGAPVAIGPDQVNESEVSLTSEPEHVNEPQSPEKDEDAAKVDSAGVPFDPELHTGTLKADGTWRVKRGKAEEAAALAETVQEDAPEPEQTEPEQAAESDQAEVTDAELQRYCGRLAAHFGGSEEVFKLAASHVPEGEMPRPTAIKDQAARRAFIEQAQKETGVIYHG